MTDNMEASELSGEDKAQDSIESLDRADTIENAEAMEREDRIELEAAIIEPEGVIERSGEIPIAEAIEGAVLESVEANDPPTDEVAEVAPISGDADDRPTEEVAAAEQGWSTSGDADDRPTEEIVTIGEANAPPTEESSVEDVDSTTSGDADDRPTEELTTVSKELMIRAFKEDEFFDVLMMDTGSALTEYGLTGEDLPDLSDPTHPETIAFVTEVENEVLEVIGEFDMSDYADELQERDSDREIRMILLNQMLNKKGNAVSQLTNMIKQAHNTDQSIINNLK